MKVASPPAKGAKRTGQEDREDALRDAAIVALQHHADNQAASAEDRAKLRKAMLTIFQQKLTAGHQADVNDYLRGRAADVLALMKEVGPGDEVVRALDKVINNPAESAKLRSRAARTLGGLDFPANSGTDFKSLADHIGHMAVDLCKKELDAAEDQTLDLKARRRLKASLQDAINGLGRESGVPPRPISGLLTGATDPTQLAVIKKIIDKLKRLDAALEKNVDGEGMLATANLTPSLKGLESVLAPREAAPKLPAAAAPVEKAKGSDAAGRSSRALAGAPE